MVTQIHKQAPQPLVPVIAQPPGLQQANEATLTDKDAQHEEDKLVELASASDQVLMRVQAVFPFQLFPDIVVLSREKIEIIYSQFFFSKSVFSILLSELSTIEIDTNPFFATMRFEVQGYEKNPNPVTHLPKQEALKLQSIIIGLMSAKKRGVAVEPIEKNILRDNAEKIGKVHTDTLAM